MLGTIMVANVFFVIIPGQRAMVAALRDGRVPDAQAGVRGKLRSVHNTYFTLPVLFTMISNHYAFTFATRWNFAALIGVCTAGALIRVYFVARHKAHERGGHTAPWPAIAGLALLLAVAALLAPRSAGTRPAVATGSRGTVAVPASNAAVPAPPRVLAIVHQRCTPCHASMPTQPGFMVAPKGVLLETPEQLVAQLVALKLQIQSRAMPIGNITQMSDDERAELIAWVDHAAR